MYAEFMHIAVPLATRGIIYHTGEINDYAVRRGVVRLAICRAFRLYSR
jgi:hypothetical protein